MTQTLLSVGFFVLLVALVPFGLKWVQQRVAASTSGVTAASRIISAIAVGPHQRVVTVEVGPEGHRMWLVLGVTAQTITCLHRTAVEPATEVASTSALNSLATLS
jgi:flagellar protein FliO/FliZ